MQEDNRILLKLYLKVLSPIHIGCDEVYEPTGFVIDETNHQMVVFEPLDFIAMLDPAEKKRFSDICAQGTVASILEIYKFLSGRAVHGKTVEICSGLISHYRKTLALPGHDEQRIKGELSNFVISRTAFRPDDQRPYIPGSSVKGALRTAYLNAVAGIKKVTTPRGRFAFKELEKTLLDGGSFDTDPFRLIKVSDFQPVGAVKTRVVYAINEKKHPSQYEPPRPFQILEVIEPDSIFQGTLSFEPPQRRSGIRTPVAPPELLKSAVLFYTEENKRELDELYRLDIKGVSAHDLPDMLPIRLGRHSGAESVTINGHRSIKIMGAGGEKPKFLDQATTIWLASDHSKPTDKNGLVPFGWAGMDSVTQDKEERFEQAEQQWLAEAKAKSERLRKEKQLKIQAREEAKAAAQKQAEEKKRQQEKAAQRAAELQAMSPEQRAIVELEDPDVQEKRVVEIFNQLEEFSEENQYKAAQLLKAYWEKNNKWSKKKCSKKQWTKVQAVKRILGQ